jgi:hypothetical protein
MSPSIRLLRRVQRRTSRLEVQVDWKVDRGIQHTGVMN